jgi:hypothetical protein
MRKLTATAALLLAAGLFSTGPAQAQPAAPEDLQRLVTWLAGEWNNNEQVWQQKLDLDDPKVLVKPVLAPHLHQVLVQVAMPQLGAHVFYLQQARADNLGVPLHQRLLRFSADSTAGTGSGGVRLETFVLRNPAALLDAHKNPALLAGLTDSDWFALPNCDLVFRYLGAEHAFEGRNTAGDCPAVLPGQNQRLRVSEQQWLLSEQGRDAALARLRKVRYFEGWFWIKVAGPTAAADDKKTSFKNKLQLHTEGQRVAVTYEDGTPSPYVLELALLTYQNTKKPILKFALLDRDTLKSVSYTWANTDASLIGMNLGWFQAGFTQKSERVNFGF